MSTAGEIGGTGPRRRATSRSRLYSEPRCYVRDCLDWYVEPPWTVERLFDAEPFIGTVCDPCCGLGTVIEVARARGHRALGSDLVKRSTHCEVIGDFLNFDTQLEILGRLGGQVDNIVSNLPFKIAVPILLEAFAVARRKVAVLVPHKFLFSQTRYHSLFIKRPPARVFYLSSRPSMPPGDLLVNGQIKARGGKVDYCWLLWDRADPGPTTTHWLCREPVRQPTSDRVHPAPREAPFQPDMA